MASSRLLALLRLPHKLALLKLQSAARSQSRLLFASALQDAGLCDHLSGSRTAAELAAATGCENPDLLEPLLALGVALGELSLRSDRYRAKGRIARALVSESGTPVACMVREIAGYHADVFRDLPRRLATAESEPIDYLARWGDVVAGASRIVEPFLRLFVERLVVPGRPLRILEIGCGSGVYVRQYCDIDSRNSGVAIDYDEKVASHARENLERWGVAGRFQVLHADIRRPPPELDGPFDLVTSFQNIYYFAPEERPSLFSIVGERLAPGGAFALASPFRTDRFLSRYYDVILRSTRGCYSFPALETLLSDLRAAGLGRIERHRLLPGDESWGVVARASN